MIYQRCIVEEYDDLDPGATLDGNQGDSSTGTVNPRDILKAHEYLEQLRQEKIDALSHDEKLQLALRRSKDATALASITHERLGDLQLKVDRGFDELSRLLYKISNGESIDDDEPNTHALDDYV